MLAHSRVPVSGTPSWTRGNTRPLKIRLARTVITVSKADGISWQISFRAGKIYVDLMNFAQIFRKPRETPREMTRPTSLALEILICGIGQVWAKNPSTVGPYTSDMFRK